MSKTMLVLHDKVLLKGSIIVETKIWKIRDKKRYPDGLKYSLFAVFQEEILVGYDNHYPKGHHKHMDGQESEYEFSTLEKLRNNFKTDLEIQIIRKGIE